MNTFALLIAITFAGEVGPVPVMPSVFVFNGDEIRSERVTGYIHPADMPDEWRAWYWSRGYSEAPGKMPPRREDGREFDKGPQFGNGSWPEYDFEDNKWRRMGG